MTQLFTVAAADERIAPAGNRPLATLLIAFGLVVAGFGGWQACTATRHQQVGAYLDSCWEKPRDDIPVGMHEQICRTDRVDNGPTFAILAETKTGVDLTGSFLAVPNPDRGRVPLWQSTTEIFIGLLVALHGWTLGRRRRRI